MKKICVAIALLFLPAAAAVRGADEKQVKADERTLSEAGLQTDGASLLKLFRERTLTPAEKLQVESWIGRLSSNSFRIREQATAKLTARGPVVVELLQKVFANPPDLEVAIRADKIIAEIKAKDIQTYALASAARLLQDRRPKNVVSVLLDFLPFADNDTVAEQVRQTLKTLSIQDGKANVLLTKSLDHKDPIIRAAAGAALARTKDGSLKKRIHKLLTDSSPRVRFRVATALAFANERSAVPVLIDSLPDLPLIYARQVEDMLFHLAADKGAPRVAVGQIRTSRERSRDAWTAWWKKHGDEVKLDELAKLPRLHGYTVVVLLDRGKVIELGRNNQVRWQLQGLSFPLDVQILPNGNLMVAEYHSSRVTERTQKGEVVWQHRVVGPLMVQRLDNGNTFIGTNTELLELDRTGARKFSFSFPNGMRIRKSSKLPNGNIVCLRDDSRIVVLNDKGRELRSFAVSLGKPLFGGKIQMLPNGSVLVPHNAENKVVEYDSKGKAVWEVKIHQPIAVRRLSNGNTLVTSMLPDIGAVEFDSEGKEVWTYRTDTRVTRALRR